MAEIIDLSNSPPSSLRPFYNAARILNYDSVSVKNNQFEEVRMSLMATTDPNLYHTNQPQKNPWPASPHINEFSQIATFQPSMQVVATALESLPPSNTFLFPNGVRLNDPRLLLMRLIKYGSGSWSKISRNLLWKKTPRQVQSYAYSFFRHSPSTYYLHSFRRSRKPTYTSASFMYKNNNLMAASASTLTFMAMVANEPQQTHMLFPEKGSFSMAPSRGEASSNSNTIMHGFQMQTSGASTSMNANANGEIDLELRLGRS